MKKLAMVIAGGMATLAGGTLLYWLSEEPRRPQALTKGQELYLQLESGEPLSATQQASLPDLVFRLEKIAHEASLYLHTAEAQRLLDQLIPFCLDEKLGF